MKSYSAPFTQLNVFLKMKLKKIPTDTYVLVRKKQLLFICVSVYFAWAALLTPSQNQNGRRDALKLETFQWEFICSALGK